MTNVDIASELPQDVEESKFDEESAEVHSKMEISEYAEELPVAKKAVQAIQNITVAKNGIRIDTSFATPISPIQPTTPVEPVQYIDEKTKVYERMAELEELRKRSDLKKKKGKY